MRLSRRSLPIPNNPTLYPTVTMKKQSEAPASKKPLDRKQIVERLVKTESDYLGTTSPDFQRGKAAGLKWAQERAAARYLRKMTENWDANREKVENHQWSMDDVVKHFSDDREHRSYCYGGRHSSVPSREFTLGFFDAAASVWGDVGDEVEKAAYQIHRESK